MKSCSSGAIAICIIIVFYIIFSLFNYSFITEDAFIYYRIAEYLVEGYGYVFNPGERIEVCSSLNWLFLLTVFRGLGFNILTTSKILGIILGCSSLLLIFKITKRFTTRMPWVILPSFLTALSTPFLISNQMGLETALYTVVFLSLILICMDKDLFIYFPVICLILILTRPEGIFLLLGLAPVFYFYREKKKRRIIYSSILLTVLCLIMILIRFFYFHDFLPSPFYVKIYTGKYLLGLSDIHQCMKDYYMYYFFVPFLYMTLKKWNWQEKRFILFGYMLVYCLWVILGGAEGKPFYRHVVPFIPLLFIYTITGIEHEFRDFAVWGKVILCIYLTIFSYSSLLLSDSYWFQKPVANPILKNIESFIENPRDYLTLCSNLMKEPAKYNHIVHGKSKQLLLGEFIKRNYASGTTLLYDQMGQTPYQAGIDYSFIDSWGLTDKKIGRYYFQKRSKGSPLFELYENISSYFIPQTKPFYSRKDIINYIFMRDPDVVLIRSSLRYRKDFIPYWLIRNKEFETNYRLKYFISGTVFYEKRGVIKKPLNIPDGLSVTFAEDMVEKSVISTQTKKIPAIPQGNGIGDACDCTP